MVGAAGLGGDTGMGRGWEGNPAQPRDRPDPPSAKEAQGNAHNHLPRTNGKIMMVGRELRAHLETSMPLLGFLACGEA